MTTTQTTALVGDDHTDTARTPQKALQKRGIHVESVQQQKEAFDLGASQWLVKGTIHIDEVARRIMALCNEASSEDQF